MNHNSIQEPSSEYMGFSTIFLINCKDELFSVDYISS